MPAAAEITSPCPSDSTTKATPTTARTTATITRAETNTDQILLAYPGPRSPAGDRPVTRRRKVAGRGLYSRGGGAEGRRGGERWGEGSGWGEVVLAIGGMRARSRRCGGT